MNKTLDLNNPILNSIFLWKFDILMSESKRRENPILYNDNEVSSIKEDVSNLSIEYRDKCLENICPLIKTTDAKDLKFFNRLKFIGIVRYEVLKVLETKKSVVVPEEQVHWISKVLNSLPNNSKELQLLTIQYAKVLDTILPDQYNQFYKYSSEVKPNIPPRQISSRLFNILRFKNKYKNIISEELNDFVKLQRGLSLLFNNDGILNGTLKDEADRFSRILYWVPKDPDDFNAVYKELIDIQNELRIEYGINLYKLGD